MFSAKPIKSHSTDHHRRQVRFIVLHYTAAGFMSSLNTLRGPAVSAHYLVPDPTELSYLRAGHKGLKVFNLVDEAHPAWHAGVSKWEGETHLNAMSLGIEMVNLASDKGGEFTFPPYHADQIDAVITLLTDIVQRYPAISPTAIVGHSDIAVGRKSDPGSAFPWKRLYEAGLGAWYDEETKRAWQERFTQTLPGKMAFLKQLERYGYSVAKAGTSEGYRHLLRAFQLHFRPQNYDGLPDAETAAILYALVDKYRGRLYSSQD